jgi:hypothetical protein
MSAVRHQVLVFSIGNEPQPEQDQEGHLVGQLHVLGGRPALTTTAILPWRPAEKQRLKRAGHRLRASEALVDRLVADGFDPRYGARPLQRTLESRVVTHLSRYLLKFPLLRDVELRLDTDAEGTLIVR